jgi:hypothetical protein
LAFCFLIALSVLLQQLVSHGVVLVFLLVRLLVRLLVFDCGLVDASH